MDQKAEIVIHNDNNLAGANRLVGVATTFIWPMLVEWLLKRDEDGKGKSRFSRFLHLIDPRNVRQALFERNKKAEAKYGSGLTVEQGIPSFQPAVEKLSDSVYFLYKTLNNAEQLHVQNPNEYNRQLNIVTDLHNILGTFVSDLKAVKVK